MSGVTVIVALLKASAGVTAIVNASRIMAGELPLKTTLPAIGVSEISSVPLNMIRVNQPTKMHIDRVQVSVSCAEGVGTGKGYTAVDTILKAALAACPTQRGTVNGVVLDSIVPDIKVRNPYDDIDLVHSGSRDLIVRWIEMPAAEVLEGVESGTGPIETMSGDEIELVGS